MTDGVNIAYHRHTVERLEAEARRLRDALGGLIPFAEEHVRLSYRDADVPQMLEDPVLKRARDALGEED